MADESRGSGPQPHLHQPWRLQPTHSLNASVASPACAAGQHQEGTRQSARWCPYPKAATKHRRIRAVAMAHLHAPPDNVQGVCHGLSGGAGHAAARQPRHRAQLPLVVQVCRSVPGSGPCSRRAMPQNSTHPGCGLPHCPFRFKREACTCCRLPILPAQLPWHRLHVCMPRTRLQRGRAHHRI